MSLSFSITNTSDFGSIEITVNGERQVMFPGNSQSFDIGPVGQGGIVNVRVGDVGSSLRYTDEEAAEYDRR